MSFPWCAAAASRPDGMIMITSSEVKRSQAVSERWKKLVESDWSPVKHGLNIVKVLYSLLAR